MKSFIQHLEEGRDAPLYHATNTSVAATILSENAIVPLYNGTNDDDSYMKTRHEFSSNHRHETTSLTRSLPFALQWASIVFELDQRKLAQTHVIRPYNYWAVDTGITRYSSIFQGKPSIYPRDGNSKADERYGNQYEEMVIKPIKPLDKYLNRIIVSHIDEISKWTSTADASERYEILLDHHLLYDWKTKRFVNQ
jgi:hypothetical protein